jgi:Fe2+ or Zn2+ uptake regulation protein
LSNPAVDELLRAETDARGFEVLAQIVEILGRCPDCLEEPTRHG